MQIPQPITHHGGGERYHHLYVDHKPVLLLCEPIGPRRLTLNTLLITWQHSSICEVQPSQIPSPKNAKEGLQKEKENEKRRHNQLGMMWMSLIRSGEFIFATAPHRI